jgi:hypothetical protein
MLEDFLTGAGKELFANGLLGIAVVGLVWFIMVLRNDLREEREAHKIEMAAKDRLILDIQDMRIVEARSVIELAKSTQLTLDAILLALRVGKAHS